MNTQPSFFHDIQHTAAKRWEQLENDRELAAPWHQLFKQVQSPRHVLSELLQNADDACATEAAVWIENDSFFFEHNGEDFTEEHFASLCRFGYSNKRALHTIGFRGIGFKSTFSLGDCVELFTPTLAVSFHRRRFTEPRWQEHELRADGKTCIRVAITDKHRRTEVQKNFEDWLKSPTSLLFSKHIRRLRIGAQNVDWNSLGDGPIPNSEWMALNGESEKAVLLVRSQPEMFPADAVEEIKQERLLGFEEDQEFPPCTVEIVLKEKGQLFVVLPTGVRTRLPFACNAPFIQDPARLKIKDPEISPTNRWLLERIGTLAADATLKWLNNKTMPFEDRSQAYGFFPDVDRKDNTLEGVCGTIVETAFEEAIASQPILLTDSGDLVLAKQSIIIPRQAFDIWSANQASELLDKEARPPLCRNIAVSDQRKLVNWGIVEQIEKQTLIRALETEVVPRPQNWPQLLKLWEYITPDITKSWPSIKAEQLQIVPVQGQDVLRAGTNTVRIGEKKIVQSEDDWRFLSAHILILDQHWIDFLQEQRRTVTELDDKQTQAAIDAANTILSKIGLNTISELNAVISQAAQSLFSQKSVTRQECVQIAQIAAALGTTVQKPFQYVTCDNYRRSTPVLYDKNGVLEYLLPQDQANSQILHPDYTKEFVSCSEEQWKHWIRSGRSSLQTFIAPVSTRVSINGYSAQKKVEQEALKRGMKGRLIYHYVTKKFIIEDWDFEHIFWSHWKELAKEDEKVWLQIVEHIFSQAPEYWERAKGCRLLQVATTGSEQSMAYEPLLSSWILRLRELPCLPDTRGFLHKPADLVRRTPETESLIDVEPFVHSRFDTEATRPLLDLLGVRNKPTGPDRLIERLRALSKAEKPPIFEVEKWYHRLDQLLDTASTADLEKIKQAFWSEKLIFTEHGTWAKADGVFLAADEDDVPGIEIIRASLCDLTLWRKINIADRATLELALEWLNGLQSGSVLTTDDVRRVRALLPRCPQRIWTECGHWLNLAGEWVPVAQLQYALTLQSLLSWGHLYTWVKQKTADLQRLARVVTSEPPFSTLSTLAQHLQEQPYQDIQIGKLPQKKEWLATFGSELRRVVFETKEDTQHIRDIAQKLEETDWYITETIKVIPYLDGTPAGTPREADVIWSEHMLFVTQLTRAKLAKRVPEEIGKAFGRDDIKAALDFSFERSSEDIRDYLEENFRLVPREDVPGLQNNAPIRHEEKTDVGTETNNSSAVDVDSNENSALIDTELYADEKPDESDEAKSDQPNDGENISETERQLRETHPRPSPKRVRLSLIERFAQSHGYRKESDTRFCHPDGSWIARTIGEAFPWERRTKSGELVRYYLPKEHCLECEAMEVEAGIWHMLDMAPETYALILLSSNEHPTEVTGSRLRTLRDEKSITVHPATYRLVYSNDT